MKLYIKILDESGEYSCNDESGEILLPHLHIMIFYSFGSSGGDNSISCSWILIKGSGNLWDHDSYSIIAADIT